MASEHHKNSSAEGLFLAAQSGDAAKVSDALQAGVDVNIRDTRPESPGFTPLMLAAVQGNAEVVAQLLQNGADVSVKDDNVQDSDSGFSFVFREGGVAMVREGGFQMHRTALGWAAESGHADVAQLLLKNGAEVDALDRAKLSPLLIAADSNSLGTVQLLLAAGADVNLRCRGKQTALMFAAEKGHADVIDALAQGGAKLELKDADGYTALMLAASKAQPASVAALIKAGADLQAKSKIGRTALHTPLGTAFLIKDYVNEKFVFRFKIDSQRIYETAKLLIDAGADPQAQDQHGATPMQMAEQMVEMTGAFHEIIDLFNNAEPGKRVLEKTTKKPAAKKSKRAE